jgi:replication initiation protein RepC
MSYIPITPFRRAVDCAVLEHQQYASAECPSHNINKWEILRELSTAKKHFGLSDRELSVLQVLLSFYPETDLSSDQEAPVVFPSNTKICERLNGMPCSTMRRHLSRLVQSGFVIRRDSPNGKRYTRRYGEARLVYGFDLTPLLTRHHNICAVAEEVRKANEAYQRLRRSVSLMKRDLQGLSIYGRNERPEMGLWDVCDDHCALLSRDLRRTLTLEDLTIWHDRLLPLLDQARDVFEPAKSVETSNVSTNDSQDEQHCQNSDKDLKDSEASDGKASETTASTHSNSEPAEKNQDNETKLPNIPLSLVLTTCSELRIYVPDHIRHWHELVQAAERLRPMMGISEAVWNEAVAAMGAEETAVVIVAMLERFAEIKSPGAYLRSLARKASIGGFSSAPMIMSLMRRAA